MARLPIPGSDAGNWGSILNDFLAVAHATDGTLKADSVQPNTIPDGSITEVKLAAGVRDKLIAAGQSSQGNQVPHQHIIADIAGLQATLDNLQAALSNFAVAQVGSCTLPNQPATGQITHVLADHSTTFPDTIRWHPVAPEITEHERSFVTLTYDGTAWIGTYTAPSAGTNPTDNTPSMMTVANISALMSTSMTVGQTVRINSFNHPNDGINVTYEVTATLPTDAVKQRVAVPLLANMYAVPVQVGTTLPQPNDSVKVTQFMEIAQTYVAAGNQLIWDSTRHTPLYTAAPIHTIDAAPYALTCSSFVNMVLSAWRYEDTTYVADTNTASHTWGTSFPQPEGVPKPWQAFLLLKWLYWSNRVAMYQEENVDYQIGDILFFSKQNPEGAGTGGTYFMNVYHTGIYAGDGKIIHSYSPDSGNGVVMMDIWPSLRDDLTFVARPDLSG